MKKIINKNTILAFILGLIISGITVYAVNYNANQIDFEPTNKEWNVTKVDKALDDLYRIKQENSSNSNSSLILLSSGWKKDTGWNSSGISNVTYISDEYLTKDGFNIIVKKDCKIRIRSMIQNVGGSTTSSPQYQLYQNSTQINALTNTKSQAAHVEGDVTVAAKTDDTFYVKMYGGGGTPTYNLTSFEIVSE